MADKTFWTPANIKRLDALVRGGALIVTLQKAAAILGTSYASLRAEVLRRGIAVNGRSFDWTPAKLHILKAMTDGQGKLILPAGRAARIIGCDKHAIVGGLLKISGDQFVPVDVARLMHLVDAGGHLTMPLHDAARALKCSPKALKTAMHKLGIRPQPHFQWTPDKLALLWSLVGNDGKLRETLAQAARHIGCSPRALQLRLALPPSKRWIPPARAVSFRVPLAPNKKPAPFQDLRDVCSNGVLTIPVPKAATTFKVSENTIRYRLKIIGAKAGNSPARITKTRDEMLLRMSKDQVLTLPVSEAAKTLRCQPETVRRSMKRLGLTFPPRGMPRRPKATRSAEIEGPTVDIAPLLALLRRWWPALPPMLVTRAVATHPPLTRMTEEGVAHRLRALAALYGIEEAAATKLAVSAPALFSEDLSALRSSHRDNARTLGLDRITYLSLVTSVPRLALLPPTVLTTRLASTGAFLDLDSAATVALIRREPDLLLASSGALSRVADRLAAALDLPLTSIKTALRRKPNLFKLYPEILIAHRDAAASLLHVQPGTVGRAFVTSPTLLQVKPETIASNIHSSAQLLQCDKSRLAAAFLQRPALLTMKPASIARRVDNLAAIFLVNRSLIVETVLKYPYLLTFAADNTAEKADLLVKLSEAVGKPATPADILTALPMAFSYSKERIALRVELAREGLGTRSVGGMLNLTDDKANALR